jgi:hypothetical protein
MDTIVNLGLGLALLAIIFGLIWALWIGPNRWSDRTDAVKRLAEEQGWQYFPEMQVVLDPSKRPTPAGLKGSLLATFKELQQYFRVLGEVRGQLFVLSVLTVGRPNHFLAQRLTVVGFEVPRESPHILIVPKRARFMGRLTLKNEYHLRPMELLDSNIEAYVPKGFAIESLQVLEPDVLELIRDERIVVELEGPSVRFIWPDFMPANRILPALDAAVRIKQLLQGVAKSELTAGSLSPALRVGWLARTFSNITANQLYFALLALFLAFATILAFSRRW